MSCPIYSADQYQEIIHQIEVQKPRLILVAGASGSGKSWIWEKLAQCLIDSGKKVLTISSDSYYSDDATIKYLLYWSFDHPDLIDYNLLEKNLNEYFSTGKTTIPEYSFIEKRRIAYHPVQEHYDIVIVEWLYTISKLSWFDKSFKIFVQANVEEVVFRRIIRDQLRVAESIYTIIGIMSTVFPMRTLYGKAQINQADAMITNDYSILSKYGKLFHRMRVKKPLAKTKKTLQKQEHSVNHIYGSDNEEYGKITISEVYMNNNPLLHHVSINKTWPIHKTKKGEEYTSIVFDLYQPWVLTELHTLLQLAGLSFIGSYHKTISHYMTENGKPLIIKSKMRKFYELIQ